jgi:hypothetical protein
MPGHRCRYLRYSWRIAACPFAGYEGENIRVTGETTAYIRGGSLSFHFCPKCGGVTHWCGLELDEQGRRRSAVNLPSLTSQE